VLILFSGIINLKIISGAERHYFQNDTYFYLHVEKTMLLLDIKDNSPGLEGILTEYVSDEENTDNINQENTKAQLPILKPGFPVYLVIKSDVDLSLPENKPIIRPTRLLYGFKIELSDMVFSHIIENEKLFIKQKRQ
jgi:hypothetical protein